MKFKVSAEVLRKYSDLLVNYALGSGNGIKKGEVVYLTVPECAKAMLEPLHEAVLKAGGHTIVNFIPHILEKQFYELAQDHQLSFAPKKYLLGLASQIDHRVVIISSPNPKHLKNIDPKKLVARQHSHKFYKDALDKKENAGLYTWTLGLFATSKMAREAGLSLKDYWEQIIKACFLDKDNPIEEWKKVTVKIEQIKEKLNNLKIKSLHIKGTNVDLKILLGDKRKWAGGSGRNIPSFELFTSPDWRGTEGTIKFNQPLYRHG